MKPPKGDDTYRRLWRMVDGAVVDALRQHPDYVDRAKMGAARFSIVKRVTGTVLSFAEQARGRQNAG